jgi:hypothetical protein
MLQSLDTLITFVVILLAASLLVTILVQMLSAAFALRGKNLGNALALTFQSIDSEIGEKAYALAERILSDPRLSHSTITRKRLDRPPTASQRLPWSWWSPFNGLQLTSAIRPQEIYDLLKKIGGPATTGESTTEIRVENNKNAPSENPPEKDKLRRPRTNISTTLRKMLPSKNQLADKDLSTFATKLLKKLGPPRSRIEAVNKEFSDLRALGENISTPDEKPKIVNAINTAQASFEAVSANFKGEVDELNKWFTAAQDRAQQWFQMHTRIFTIICGIVLAFLLQLDAAEIFKFVSTNATERAALAASADKLVEKADGVLEKNGSLLDRIYDTVKKKITVIDLQKDVRTAAVNSAALKKAIQNDMTHKVPTDFGTKYDAAEKEAVAAYYKDRRAQMDDLTKGVAATGFDLMPNKLGHRWDNEQGSGLDHFRDHLWGMLITAALLSLGAPYWYNVLKNVTSLRTALAKLIGEEKSAEEENR